jgi:transcriptional regulator with XRE-family HTH domain
MSLSVVLGERVRAARSRLGLSQEQLAERAGFAHHQIVSQIELGQREIKAVECRRAGGRLRVEPGPCIVERTALG